MAISKSLAAALLASMSLSQAAFGANVPSYYNDGDRTQIGFGVAYKQVTDMGQESFAFETAQTHDERLGKCMKTCGDKIKNDKRRRSHLMGLVQYPAGDLTPNDSSFTCHCYEHTDHTHLMTAPTTWADGTPMDPTTFFAFTAGNQVGVTTFGAVNAYWDPAGYTNRGAGYTQLQDPKQVMCENGVCPPKDLVVGKCDAICIDQLENRDDGNRSKNKRINTDGLFIEAQVVDENGDPPSYWCRCLWNKNDNHNRPDLFAPDHAAPASQGVSWLYAYKTIQMNQGVTAKSMYKSCEDECYPALEECSVSCRLFGPTHADCTPCLANNSAANESCQTCWKLMSNGNFN